MFYWEKTLVFVSSLEKRMKRGVNPFLNGFNRSVF